MAGLQALLLTCFMGEDVVLHTVSRPSIVNIDKTLIDCFSSQINDVSGEHKKNFKEVFDE